MRWKRILMVSALIPASPAAVSAQDSGHLAWAALAAGGTSGGDVLVQASAWYSWKTFVIGARRSSASELFFAEYAYEESSILAGIRKPMGSTPRHTTMMLVAGIAQTGGWKEPSTGCFLGCNAGSETPLPIQYAPTASMELQVVSKWVGAGLSVMGVGGPYGYMAGAVAVQVGALR